MEFRGLTLEWLIGSNSVKSSVKQTPLIFEENLKQFRIVGTRAAGKSPQSSPTLCDPIDSSPPGSTVPGILQARALEWVAISFSNA